MELIQQFSPLLYGILSVLALMLVLCLIRAVIGPRIADRLVAVNRAAGRGEGSGISGGYLSDLCHDQLPGRGRPDPDLYRRLPGGQRA